MIRNTNSFFSTGITDIFNSILWGDTATNNGAEIFVANGTVSAFYSDVEGGWPGPGSNNIDLDPKFADPEGDDDIAGTEDDDLRLLVMSPAIDVADTASGPLDDFFGQLRPIDGDNMLGAETDMGAVEYVPDPSTCFIMLVGASCGLMVYRRRR